MSKTNFFVKYLKNISNLINNLLEKNLNKLNFKNLSFLFKNNKIILTFVALLIISLSYLLAPSFFIKDQISNFDKLQDISRQLTYHEKWGNSYNVAPSISHDGSKIALLSNKSGTMGILFSKK